MWNTCSVNDCIVAFNGFDNAFEIQNVDLVMLHFLFRRLQIKNADSMLVLQQLIDDVLANQSASASDENFHKYYFQEEYKGSRTVVVMFLRAFGSYVTRFRTSRDAQEL